MFAELTNGFSTCEIVCTETFNGMQIEHAKLWRYRSYGTLTTNGVPELLRVLVVDDHHDEARMLEILIKRWGHDCRIAIDGARGLNSALDFRPHVLLIDVVMPHMSGAELTINVRMEAFLKDSLVVALSGSTGLADRKECELAGVDHYFIKPMSTSMLNDLLTLEAAYVARRHAVQRSRYLIRAKSPMVWSPVKPQSAPHRHSSLST